MSSHLHEKPSMEEMQLKLIEILTVGHETLDDEHDELVADITGIQAFLARPAKEVYSLEHQAVFYKFVNKIASAYSVVDLVVSDEKKQMYSLEMGQPLADDLSTPPPAQLEKQEGSGFMGGIFSKKKKPIPENSPYSSLLPSVNKKMAKIDRIERFIEMYAHGQELLDVVGEDSSAIIDYLAIHRQYFSYDVAYYVVRIHKQYVEMRKAKEKSSALAVSVSNQRDLYRAEQQKAFMGG
jgi:hypothetical protein